LVLPSVLTMHLMTASDSPIPDIRPTSPPIFGGLEPVIPVLVGWAGAFLVIGLIVMVIRLGSRRTMPDWLLRAGTGAFCLGLVLAIIAGLVFWVVDASTAAKTVFE
jgi:hypothetical protein